MKITATIQEAEELVRLRKQDEVHWKTRRILLLQIEARDQAIRDLLCMGNIVKGRWVHVDVSVDDPRLVAARDFIIKRNEWETSPLLSLVKSSQAQTKI